MKILKIDKDRFIIKEADQSKITGKWKMVTDAVVDVYKKIFDKNLISVYVGGSIALGEAIENKSDVDTYAIVDLDPEELDEIDKIILKSEKEKLNTRFPFQTKVEMHLYSKDSIGLRKSFQLGLLATRIYGSDVIDESKKYILSKDTFQKVRVSISDDIVKAHKKISNATTSMDIKLIGTWIAKRLIRDAGTLVMWKGDFYTMDIQLMVKIFTDEYSNKKVEIDTLENWVNNPPESKEEIIQFLNNFGKWLVEEDERIFSIN